MPPARLGAYLREFRALLTEYGLRGAPYGHFGDGCIHVRIDFDLLPPAGSRGSARFSEELADLVVAHGGSLSGEHGDGQARAELLPRMYGDEMVGALRPVQGSVGPGRRPQPGHAGAPGTASTTNLRFAPLPRGPVDVDVRLPARRGRLLGRRPPLRRRRQVPQRARRRARRDVPVVPGDRRGGALHARAGPAAARDARGRGRHRRLAVRGGAATRSTCACPARAAAATARSAWTWPPTRRSSCTTTTRRRLRPAPPTTRWAGCRGGCGSRRPRYGAAAQRGREGSAARRAGQAARRASPRNGHPGACARRRSPDWSAAAARRGGGGSARRWSCGRTPSPTTCPRKWAGPRCGSSRTPGCGRSCRPGRCAAA